MFEAIAKHVHVLFFNLQRQVEEDALYGRRKVRKQIRGGRIITTRVTVGR